RKAWPPSSRSANRRSSTVSATAVLLAAHILSMLGFSTYRAMLPGLRDEWHLSNAQAGVIGGMFFAGYVLTVSYWTALTHRPDPRPGYLNRRPVDPASGV